MAKKAKKEEIKTVLRLPKKLHTRLGEVSDAAHRSINSEIIVALEKHCSIKA